MLLLYKHYYKVGNGVVVWLTMMTLYNVVSLRLTKCFMNESCDLYQGSWPTILNVFLIEHFSRCFKLKALTAPSTIPIITGSSILSLIILLCISLFFWRQTKHVTIRNYIYLFLPPRILTGEI